MAVSFAHDILPLFRPIDIAHMKGGGVLLDSYAYMSDPAHAKSVLDSLTGAPPHMPPGGPYWSPEQLDLLQKWIADGYQP